MSEEILINNTPHETRVAVVENGVLQEFYLERNQKRGIVGNIIKGRVSRILPGMQAAFVDIGAERAAFLHASDINNPVTYEENHFATPVSEMDIQQLLFEGQELLVQVTKDPLGTKGARLTTHLTIPSRYLVYIPDMEHIALSQRIEDEQERTRLLEIVTELTRSQSGGYIIRTNAESASEESLQKDIDYLHKVWACILNNAKELKVGVTVYEDLPLVKRTIRDLVRPNIEKVRIDSPATYHELLKFINAFMPNIKSKLELFESEQAIFDLYAVEEEIQRTLEPKVLLKSGGYLVIDETEAMATIDVNTGGFVGHRNLDETILKTNLEATQAIAKQLRLRNLGGIIIIDFIDMVVDEHKEQVMRTLIKMLEKDHVKTFCSSMSELGLVQITRKRTRESLLHMMCQRCEHCKGRGYVKSPETVCNEITREIQKSARTYGAHGYLVMAAPSVIDRLMDEQSTHIAELEALIEKPIKLQAELFYPQGQYDVVMV